VGHIACAFKTPVLAAVLTSEIITVICFDHKIGLVARQEALVSRSCTMSSDPAAAADSKGFSLLRPSSDINYRFVSGAYMLLAVLGVIFKALEYLEKSESIKGVWLIFAPFAPCLLWSLAMQSMQSAVKPKTS
jgi:hypothetical protein